MVYYLQILIVAQESGATVEVTTTNGPQVVQISYGGITYTAKGVSGFFFRFR